MATPQPQDIPAIVGLTIAVPVFIAWAIKKLLEVSA